MDADDRVKAWVNGVVVSDKKMRGRFNPGKIKVNIDLRKGDNVLMLKISQGGGAMLASCRLKSSDGKDASGVTTKLK